jgi:hypothetical protein
MLRRLTALAVLLLSASAARAQYGCYGGFGGVGTPTAYGLATMKGEQIHVRQYVMRYQPQTAVRTRKVKQEGQWKDVTEQFTFNQVVPAEIRQKLDPAKLKITDAAGTKVGADALAQRLKEETPVLMVLNGQELDARYRKLLKKGTLVLTLPRQQPIPPESIPPADAPIEDAPKGKSPREEGAKSDGPRREQPSFAGASIDAKGILSIRESGGTTTTQKAYLKAEGEGTPKGPVKIREVFAVTRMRSLEASGVHAQRADGKAVSTASLRQLLKKELPVLVSQDGKRVDPYYSRIFRGDTLILVLPQPEPAYYGGPAAVPPAEPLPPPPGKQDKGADPKT